VGFWDGLTSWLASRFTKSRASRIMAGLSLPFGAGKFGYNSWSDNRGEQVKHFKSWVYISINAIASKVAQLSPQVAIAMPAPTAPGSKRYRYRGLNLGQRRKALTQIAPSEDLEPVGFNHPLVRLLRNPNQPDTAGTFMRELCIFLHLTGNAYIWLPPEGNNAFGMPSEMFCLPSHWMWPMTGKSGLIEYYEVRPVYSNSTVLDIPADQVVHLPFKSPISKIDGWSPQTAIARWIDSSEALDQSRWHSFANLAQLGPMLLLDPDALDPDGNDIERLENRFMSRFSGPTKAGRPILLQNVKDIKFATQGTRELDFGASSEQLRDYILAAFGVPKQVAGFSDGLTFGGNLATIQWFCSNTINPLTHFLGENLTEKVAPRFDEGKNLRVWWDDASPEDPGQKLAENQAYLQAGVLCLNEVRQDLGLEPYEGFGDLPILPMGVSEFSGGGGQGDDMDLLGMAGLPGGSEDEAGHGRLTVQDETQETPEMPAGRLSAARRLPSRNGRGKGGWSESDHPRADNGQFGSGGGASNGTPLSGSSSATAHQIFQKPDAKTTRDSKLHPSDDDLPTQMKDYASDLSEYETAAIKEYTQGRYNDVNRALRRGEGLDEEDEAFADRLRSTIRKAGDLPKPITVWRGVQLPANQAESLKAQLKEGNKIEMPGFTSTTLNPTICTKFSGSEGGSFIFEIEAKQGAYIGAIPGRGNISKEEREFLLPDASQFEVGKVETVKFRNSKGKVEKRQIVKLRQVA
jgi:HK97 family phage portal protein